MKGTTLAAFLIVFVGVALAHPWNERRGRISQVSSRRSVNSVAPSPYYYLRSPRYVSQNDQEYLPIGGRRFRVFRDDQQNEESEEEDDDVADDDDDQDDDEPENEQFDTPTWEKMFPREEQGSQGQDVAGGPPRGGYSSGGPQGGGPPEGYTGTNSEGDTYEAILPQDSRYGAFGGDGGSDIGGQGRTGYSGQHVKRGRPVAVRVVRPRQYSGVNPLKKSNSWAVYQPQVQDRHSHYYGQRNSRPQPYSQYVYAQPSASRRWAYQPARQVPQYAYQSRPVYRRSFAGPNGANMWGRQRRSRN